MEDDELLVALRQLTGDPSSAFRPHQREAIEALVGDRSRVLLVQRTGWGKSAVYFVATAMLRARGLGPTFLVSPLLALMRNQIEAAERTGLRAFTVNSASDTTVEELRTAIDADAVDIVLVSPERLANPEFAERIVPVVGSRPGLIVIDEVHCISDWGHDFRPDYRRIVGVLDRLADTVPVLGCTATANERVVADVEEQLGRGITTFRGSLRRDSLRLSVTELPARAARLAWLAANLERLPGTGVVYCLTKHDTDLTTAWLQSEGFDVLGYHGDTTPEDREEAERRLLHNEVKALAATSALGMGYDKPDLGFVVHYQAPGSPVAYYQQVGRAGRALDAAHAVLLVGDDDRSIQNHFIDTAFPAEDRVDAVLAVFDRHDGQVSVPKIENEVNIGRSALQLVLKQLDVEGVLRRRSGMSYERTSKPWQYPHDRVEAVTAARRREQRQMLDYIGTHDCRMVFLTSLLDDPDRSPCGRCDRCTGQAFGETPDVTVEARADEFVRGRPLVIEPRRQSVDKPLRLEEGRALCRRGSGGWAPLVRDGREVDHEFDDRLVAALASLIDDWSPTPPPGWVTAVPSLRTPQLVDSLARRVAERLGLPYRPVVRKLDERPRQETQRNSAHQRANVAGAFAVDGAVPDTPVLLLDDLVDSRWTITEVGGLLRAAGSGPVHPVALASSIG